MNKEECVDIELDLSDELVDMIEEHMKISGLNFNDALTELIIMGMQAQGIDI